jgi:hypothetical protein
MDPNSMSEQQVSELHPGWVKQNQSHHPKQNST